VIHESREEKNDEADNKHPAETASYRDSTHFAADQLWAASRITNAD
jgi:hypothetical protein